MKFKFNKNLKDKKSVYVFIDASNLWEAQKAFGKFVDYEKIIQFIKTKFNSTSLNVFYYTAYPKEGTRNYDLVGKHNFFTFLKKGLNFTVRKKALKRIIINENGKQIIKEKGNMDVEITIDAIHNMEKYDIAILFTGDCDFLALVNYIRNKGKKVYIFSSKNNISNELRTGADGYEDILKIKENIWGKKLTRRESKIK